MFRSVFMNPQSLFDLAILSFFIKIVEFFKANKWYFFFVIKYQVVYNWIDNKMIFQKNWMSPTFSQLVGLGSRSKGRFRITNLWNIWPYQLAREYDQPIFFFSERLKKNLEKISLTFRSYLFIFVLWDLKLMNFLYSVVFLD